MNCELFNGRHWVTIDLAFALKLPNRDRLRCVECGGRVRAHRKANNGMVAHFEHHVAHDGCSLGHNFNGVKSRHPKPMA